MASNGPKTSPHMCREGNDGLDRMGRMRMTRPCSLALLALAPIILVALYDVMLAGALIICSLLFLIILSHRGKAYLLRQLTRSLIRSRKMICLSITCVILSVAGASLALTIHDSLDNYTEFRASSIMGPIDLMLGTNKGVHQDYHLSDATFFLEDLRRSEGVASAYSMVVGNAPILGGHGSGVIPSAGYMGIYEDAMITLGGFETVDGRILDQEPTIDEAFVNPSFMALIDCQKGDYIFLLYGERIYPFQVSEVVTASGLGGYGSDRPFIFINMNAAGTMMGQPGTCNALAIELDPGVDRGKAIENVNDVLNAHTDLALEVVGDKEVLGFRTSSVLTAPATVLLIFGALTLVLGMAVLNNLYWLMMESRRTDLQLLRALGVSRRDTLLAILDEGLLLGAVGGVAGTIVGIAISFVCLNLLRGITTWGWNIPVLLTIEPGTVLLCVGLGIISTLLIAYISFRSILRERSSDKGGHMPWSLFLVILLGILLYCSNLFESVTSILAISTLLFLGELLLIRKRLNGLLIGTAVPVIFLMKVALVEDSSSQGVLAPALLISLVLFYGTVVPPLLRRWSRDGKRGGARVRLAIANLTHPRARLKTSIMTYSSIFILLAVTTGLSGMVIAGAEKAIDQSSWNFDTIAYRDGLEPFKSDLWSQINRTQGVLEGGNITMMAPVHVQAMTIEHSSLVSMAPGNNIQYGVYGFDQKALSMLNLPLSEFDQDLFEDSSLVWECVLASDDLAIIDSNLRYDVATFSSSINMGIRVGEVISILDGKGGVTNATVVGVTEQRLLSGIFVSSRLLNGSLGVEGPSAYLIDYSPGLDSEEQSQNLESDLFFIGVTTMNMAGVADDVTNGVKDAMLVMRLLIYVGLLIGVVGIVSLNMRSLSDRKTDIEILRSIGMSGRNIGSSMLIETAMAIIAGLSVGLIAGSVMLHELWWAFLEPLNIGYSVDWASMIAIELATLLTVIILIYTLNRCATRRKYLRMER